MQYRIYKDNVKIKETTTKQVEITGLKPKTTYTLGVSAYNGLRESTRATITMTTRGLVMTVDKSLPVNSEVTLEYVEYPLGSVPIGSEPTGMFGGGDRKKLKARVLSSANGSSTLELLQAIEDTKTNLIVDADDPKKWSKVNAVSGGVFNFTDEYAELTVSGLTQDRWIGFSMNIIPKVINVGDEFTISVPLYISSSTPYQAGAVCIKEHASGKVAIAQNLPDGPKDKWFNLELTKSAGVKLTDTSQSFYLFLGRNGSIKVGKPTMYYTNEQPSSFKDNAHLRQNLQAGGINLLRQSQLGSNYTHDAWRENFGGITWNSNTVELNVGNKDCVQIEQRIYNIEPDSDYVFSFDLNYADEQHLDKQGFIFWEFKDSEGKQTTSVYKDNWTSMAQLSSVPGRSNKKIVIHTQPDTHMIIFMVRSLKGATQPFRLSKVKFEQGTEPTQWSLARQDIYGTDQLDSGFSAFDGYKAVYLK